MWERGRKQHFEGILQSRICSLSWICITITHKNELGSAVEGWYKPIGAQYQPECRSLGWWFRLFVKMMWTWRIERLIDGIVVAWASNSVCQWCRPLRVVRGATVMISRLLLILTGVRNSFWYIFRSGGFSNVSWKWGQTTPLGSYEHYIRSNLIFHLIFQSNFMRRFYFWSRFGDNFPSDGEKKLPVTSKMKIGFRGFLKIPGIYVFSDSRFGIYTKSYVYTNIFDTISTFWLKVLPKTGFRPKTGFCSSRTAQRTFASSDLRFGKFMLESTYG